MRPPPGTSTRTGRPSHLRLTVDDGGRIAAEFTRARRRYPVEGVTPEEVSPGVWKVRQRFGGVALEWQGWLPDFPEPGGYVLPYLPRKRGSVSPYTGPGKLELQEENERLRREVARLRAALLEGFEI